MAERGKAYFSTLQEILVVEAPLASKYGQLRQLVEQFTKAATADETLQFANLFSRIHYIADSARLDTVHFQRLNAFRIHANLISKGQLTATPTGIAYDSKAIAEAIGQLFEVFIPSEVAQLLPKDQGIAYPDTRPKSEQLIQQIRVLVYDKDDMYIYGYADNQLQQEPMKIKYNLLGINEEFNGSIAKIWKGCQLNLIDVEHKENGDYHPQMIILEPDYLLDISSLAECMKDYGAHPLNYLKSKLEPSQNTKHILLGNAANAFLDDFVNQEEEAESSYATSMRKVFKNSPFEFSTCQDLNLKEHEHLFFEDTKTQFKNIQRVVQEQFKEKHIDRRHGILEPSFMCEPLGIQGRLDYLQLQSENGQQFVVELKSGKAPFPETNHSLIAVNHESQAFLYQIVVQKVLGVPFSNLKTYIFYSKYQENNANLRLSTPYMAAIKKILNVRNSIVAHEHLIATAKDTTTLRDLLLQINPEELIQNPTVSKSFLERYIVPQIEHFRRPFIENSALVLRYFYQFYSFVAKEHYIAKAGVQEGDNHRSVASLWQSSVAQKLDAGEIFIDLRILENKSAAAEAYIKLAIPDLARDFLPNFRTGDIVILYERNNDYDSVRNKQIFKGSIQAISPTEIVVRLRYKQQNAAVIPSESLFAIEHDYLDSSYSAMYRALYAFLKAAPDRQDLLLNQRPAQVNKQLTLSRNYISPEMDEIVLKAKQAKDYFLIVGPPGTGKTSIALKAMVEEFMTDPNHQILLLSYTNRAVDEICEALDAVDGKPDYIRVGSELSCELKHRPRLLNEVIKHMGSRAQVKELIQQHRIFVGTVASLASKTELFNLKHFHTAIIDEASQILEPNLLGILSARNSNGQNAVGRFILIGDTKQLPAVVLQSAEESKIQDASLLEIGITDRRQSLFERLYKQVKTKGEAQSWAILRKHGRMHPVIAAFPNIAFYNNELLEVPTKHQAEELVYQRMVLENVLQRIIATKRLAFFELKPKQPLLGSFKSNPEEAAYVQQLAAAIYSLYMQNDMKFSTEDSLGIITPYRSQIALIKRELHKLGIPALNEISVDTVERFQGSQRDIIIYNFCVNQPYQLEALGNVIEEEGQLIDRKLNVALTRAKKQLFLVGNPDLLAKNQIYYKLIQFIKARQGYIEEAELAL